jgi:peroxin-5
MNNLFQNGPKQINIEGGVTSTNAFKQMVDSMAMNQTHINERLEQMGNRPTSYADMHLENTFNNMNLNTSNQNFQFQEKHNLINLENQWNTNLNFQQQNAQSNLIDLNPQLNNIQFNNFNANQNFRFGMGAPQVHPMLMEFNKSLHLETQSKTNQIENANQASILAESLAEQNLNNENPNDIFKDIIEVMEGQDDERHKSSEFLRFIKKLHTGEIKLNEKTNDIEVTQNSGLSIPNQLSKENNIESFEDEKKLEDMWNKLESNLHEIDYKMDYENLQKDRLFLANNQFTQELGPDVDLLQVAKDFLSKNDSQNARLALEAEINKNPDNSEAWLILGKIHTENDRDDLAMQCFLKAIDADPFNGEALLALGISCTNEFDEFDAMVYIADWIKLHPAYNKFYDKTNPVLNYDMIRFEMESDRPDEDYYAKALRIQSLKNNFYGEMTQIMDAVVQTQAKPQDLDLLIAMGISNFIQNKNDRAIECFRKAVENVPNDYTAWNKLGAILAHSNMNEEAINTYKKALSLKPNYARCWSNIGLAHFNLKNYDEAVRCFLTSLKCYKDIDHVWSYLNSVLIAGEKTNLSELVYARNLGELLRIYNV